MAVAVCYFEGLYQPNDYIDNSKRETGDINVYIVTSQRLLKPTVDVRYCITCHT